MEVDVHRRLIGVFENFVLELNALRIFWAIAPAPMCMTKSSPSRKTFSNLAPMGLLTCSIEAMMTRSDKNTETPPMKSNARRQRSLKGSWFDN